MIEDFKTGSTQPLDQDRQFADKEAGMSLSRRTKVRFNSKMNFHHVVFEPGASPDSQFGRLRFLFQLQQS